MRIEVRQKFLPFSTLPGTTFCLLGTFWKVQVFPQRLFFQNIEGSESFELIFCVQGRWKDFIVFQNLEKGIIEVSGHTSIGYIRYQIKTVAEGIELLLERGKDFSFQVQGKLEKLLPKIPFLLKVPLQCYKPCEASQEKLFLGMHKAQDWNLLEKRQDLKEILPIWYALAKYFPESKLPLPSSLQKLLDRVSSADSTELNETFLELFLAGFSGMLVPQLFDDKWQGIIGREPLSKNTSPMPLLYEGAKLIRALFFTQQDDKFFILPKLPPQFFCGRFIKINCEGYGMLSIEWSKKLLKKMVFHSNKNFTMRLGLQSSLDSFRLKSDTCTKHCDIGTSIAISAGKTYFFDHFQK